MKEGDRVEVRYPAHWLEHGTITRFVPRHDAPAIMTICLDNGVNFICDETLVKLVEDE